VVMSWIAGFLRAFRRVCRRLFCGGLCTLFIRRAYLHTTSSVLVHRATVYSARAVDACGQRIGVICMVCVSACWISSVVCVVCVVRFPTLPTRRAIRTSCPRSARCITACHARTNMHMCKVGWCACGAWHATHASHARIFLYRCGYSQNRVAPEDVEKTAFVGPEGLWEWLVIPQGIATAPAWFMRMVSELLAQHKAYCVVFIDDILFSATKDEHERHVRAVLDTLRKQGFGLKIRNASSDDKKLTLWDSASVSPKIKSSLLQSGL
jgi:hypothetical protein